MKSSEHSKAEHWRGESQPGFTNRSQPKSIGNCWSATVKPSCGTEAISQCLIDLKTRGWRTTCRNATARRAATILCGLVITMIAHPCGSTPEFPEEAKEWHIDLSLDERIALAGQERQGLSRELPKVPQAHETRHRR